MVITYSQKAVASQVPKIHEHHIGNYSCMCLRFPCKARWPGSNAPATLGARGRGGSSRTDPWLPVLRPFEKNRQTGLGPLEKELLFGFPVFGLKQVGKGTRM